MADRPRRGCIRTLVRLVLISSPFAVLFVLLGLVALGYLYRKHIVLEPGPHVDPHHIRSIIAQESPVYYRDGTTRVGVFFANEHRQYVGWDQFPLAYLMSIVAAEDDRFWSHHGVDPKGIARAMWANLSAGTLVAGGSTLTQQTAKNLYYRPDRSLKSKWTELLNALRLEAHYDKRQILTFYANQFHVSGNGRGLGIAARHFFDKEPEALTLVESAFLAGLVKSPARYDPFLGDEARSVRARERAHTRTRYVLRRLVEEPIEQLVPPRTPDEPLERYEARLLEAGQIRAEAARLLEEGFTIPFRKGTFRFEPSAVLDEVARRLREPPFDDVLEAAGIDDPATAGLKVITTLDPDAQRSAIYGLWHHLTEVGVWLEGHTQEDFEVKGSIPYDPTTPLTLHGFYRAEVVERPDQPRPHLVVDTGGHRCVVDRDAVVRAAVAVERGRTRNRRAKVRTAQVDAFLDGFEVGDRVLVSVRSLGDGDAEPRCDLELRPELQGAVLVLEGGEIRAMVGGNDNRNFNRTTALRQMGSTWKPLLFHAALELGWSPSDILDNRRGVFPFSTTFYYPRPDHEPAEEVSLSWAGVNSENLASVWLLYHLVDKLDPRAFAELARTLDLARREDESRADYARRIQELGVLPTPRRRVESTFLETKANLLRAGLSYPEDELALRSLAYGWGFEQEEERVRRAGGKQREAKLRALRHRWTFLRDRLKACRAQHLLAERAWTRGAIPDPAVVSDLSARAEDDRIAVACGETPDGYAPLAEVLREVPTEPPPDGAMSSGTPPKLRFPWSKPDPTAEAPRRPDLAPFADTLIEGRLHAKTLVELEDALERARLTAQLAEPPDLYDPEVLYWHQDFRVLMSLHYLRSMARTYGVGTPLEPVLSLPLGSNAITLEEVASVYTGITTGTARSFPGTGLADFVSPPSPALLIKEIRDVDDRVLYRADAEVKRIAPVEAGQMTADILRNVVLHGTGRRARDAVREKGRPVPLGGKTGTTNGFKNAVFVGFAPRASGAEYRVEDGLIVAAYIGYDDNRPMVNGPIRLAGASGALPAWIGTVQGLHEAGLLGSIEDGAHPVGDAWPLARSPSLVRITAAEGAGLPQPDTPWTPGRPGILVPLPSIPEAPVVRFTPDPRPTRIAPSTDRDRRPSLRDLWGRRRRNGRTPASP